MVEIWRAKFGLGTLLTTLMVSLSYEIKEPAIEISPFVLVICSFLISTYLANTIVNKALGWKIGRKIIMGRTWIEGHWILNTTTVENNDNAISQLGLCYISYQGGNYELSVITYRKKYDKKLNTGFSSLSDLVTIRSSDKIFSNIFGISNGYLETNGVTTGKFFNDGQGIYPNTFEGHVTLFNEGITRRQTATKISDKTIRKLMKEKGLDWKDECLKMFHKETHTNAPNSALLL